MNNDFFNSLKVEQDPDEKKLLEIQERIKESSLDKKTIQSLTNSLTLEQKEKLNNLYKKQNDELQNSLMDYKNEIMKIQKRIHQN